MALNLDPGTYLGHVFPYHHDASGIKADPSTIAGSSSTDVQGVLEDLATLIVNNDTLQEVYDNQAAGGVTNLVLADDFAFQTSLGVDVITFDDSAGTAIFGGHILFDANDTYDIGDATNAVQTIYLNNNNGVSIQYPTANGTSATTNYKINVGGGADAGAGKDEGGTYTVEFEECLDFITNGGARNQIIIDFRQVNFFNEPEDNNALIIRNDINTNFGNTIGMVDFLMSAGGILASNPGAVIQLTNTGTTNVVPMQFKNQAGKVLLFDCNGGDLGEQDNKLLFGNDPGFFAYAGIDANFYFEQRNTVTINRGGNWDVFLINPADMVETTSAGTRRTSLNIEPFTLSGVTITDTSTVRIGGPTAGGTSNWSFWVDDGISRFDGDIYVNGDSVNLTLGAGQDADIYYDATDLIIDPDVVGTGRVLIGATGDDDMLLNSIEIDGDLNHDGANIGFFGTAPAAQSAAYTPTNVSADRAYDANSTSLDEVADVLGTLIADLQAYGLVA